MNTFLEKIGELNLNEVTTFFGFLHEDEVGLMRCRKKAPERIFLVK